MKISVLTPTYRPGGLDLVNHSLKKQTFDKAEFEWIICSPYQPDESLYPHKWIPDNFKEKYGLVGCLNHIYNEMIRQSSGDIIVSIQDYTWFPRETLQVFWSHYETLGPRAVVSGVGDHYGEIDKFNKPQVIVWNDPRKAFQKETGRVFYECYHQDIEANFCYYPTQMFYDIGGWDEKLDYLGVGMDNVSVSQRADALGYKFYLDQSLECRPFRHDIDPKLAGPLHNMHGNYYRRMDELQSLPSWPKLEYLKK